MTTPRILTMTLTIRSNKNRYMNSVLGPGCTIKAVLGQGKALANVMKFWESDAPDPDSIAQHDDL